MAVKYTYTSTNQEHMKNLKLLSAFLFVLSLVNNILAQPKENPNSRDLLVAFQKQTDKWKEAYNSGNAQNLVPLYSEDAKYISSHVSGLEAIGRDKLIANFQNGMSMGGHIDSVEILSMNISCELATLLCKYQATNNGQTVAGRNLLVLRKTKGMWLIVVHITVV